MTSQPGKETITIHILPNISQSKSSQTLKFGQLVECNKRNICLQTSSRKLDRKTSFRPFFFLKKALDEVKASGLQLSFSIFR